MALITLFDKAMQKSLNLKQIFFSVFPKTFDEMNRVFTEIRRPYDSEENSMGRLE